MCMDNNFEKDGENKRKKIQFMKFQVLQKKNLVKCMLKIKMFYRRNLKKSKKKEWSD